jgi:HK97 family phage prohead protease
MPQHPKLRDLTAIEVRRVRTPATIRATDNTDDDSSVKELRFTGHAAVFESPTWIGPPKWGFQEVIARGAFAKTITESDVRFLINHDPNLILARTTAGTMTLLEDKIGLAVDAQLAATSYGQDLAVSLERGDMSQMSFGFRVVREEWEDVEVDGGAVIERRTLLEVELFDVSSVTYPAYEDTDGGLAAAELARELRDRRNPTRATRRMVDHLDVRAGDTAEPSDPDPATPAAPTAATSPPADPAASTPVDKPGDGDDGLPLHTLLLAHAAGDHAGTSRAKCPPCTKALTQTPPVTTSGTSAA